MLVVLHPQLESARLFRRLWGDLISQHMTVDSLWLQIEAGASWILRIGGLAIAFLQFWVLVVGMFTIPYA